MTKAIHPFERSHLGLAPFRCVGWYESKYQACHGAPIQPGSSCDYCGQGIMLVFRIKSSDGKEFKVGCDCVAKTARECAKTDIERDARSVVDQVNKIRTAVSNARKDEHIKAAIAKLDDNASALDIQIEIAGKQRNAFDYLRWMFTHGGRTGKLKAAKKTDELLRAIERHRAAVNDDIIRHEQDGRFAEIKLEEFAR